MSGRSKKYDNEPEEKTGDLSGQTTEETSEEKTVTEKEADEQEIKIASLEQEIFDYRDKLVRKAAEFENYKKRTSEEFIRLIDSAGEEIITRLLPVLDDIDRFEKNYNDNISSRDLKKGVDMIFGKLRTVLGNQGLQEIEALEHEFDPDYHDALMMAEKEGCQPNMVIDQHEKGYRLKDKVIRHSKVVVSK